jgi:diaminohydroxyphosphoribosylaminopyrimidine deaminase/5-amino-6-(5-phosphoribosylamino)uracil reductase
MIFASQRSVQAKPHIAQELSNKGVELLAYPNTGHSNLHFLVAELSNRGITQLLVEGGPTILTSFLRENLADEIIVYIAPKILGSQSSVGITKSMAELSEAVGLHNVEIERFGDDVCFRGLTEKAMDEISFDPESSFEIQTVSEPVNE